MFLTLIKWYISYIQKEIHSSFAHEKVNYKVSSIQNNIFQKQNTRMYLDMICRKAIFHYDFKKIHSYFQLSTVQLSPWIFPLIHSSNGFPSTLHHTPLHNSCIAEDHALLRQCCCPTHAQYSIIPMTMLTDPFHINLYIIYKK